jgi:replicative DNA helicase
MDQKVSNSQQPQSVDAEASLLGAILIDGDAIVKIADTLTHSDFFDPRHKHIYEAASQLYAKHSPIDVLTLSEQLKNNGTLDIIGGASYLTELTNFVPTAAHAEQYAEIIAQKSLRRNLISASQDIVSLGYNESKSLKELIDEAESRLFAVSQKHLKHDVIGLDTILAESFDRLDELHKDKKKIRGTPTGYKDLDRVLAGLQKSDLIVLASRPSMGKTALALNIAHNVAVQTKLPVLIFSLEMSKEQLVDRLLAMESGVDAWALRTGNLTDSDFEKIGQAMGTLSEAPIFIDDTPSITVSDLRTKARREAHQRPLGLVIVDYLQLMSGSSRFISDVNRVQEVSDISKNLKSIARELNVPLLAVSQLSRLVESRSPQIPQLADLRESGCLTGDTLIYLPKAGVYKKIKELVEEKNLSVSSLDIKTKRLVIKAVARAFSTGIKPVYRLTTNSGRTLRATTNHKFLTINGWKRLDEIAVMEHIALPRYLPGPRTSNNIMSNAELGLLGHLIGDGCTLPSHAIQYTAKDLDLAEIVANLCREAFGTKIIPRINKERSWYQVYLPSALPLTHKKHNPISKWLLGLGVFGLRSYEKLVPELVFNQSPESIAIFIRHLWATDGCIQIKKGIRQYPTIYYASSSERLARDLQSLLLRLNIMTKLRVVKQYNKGRDQYHVIISGKDDLLNFINKIGVVGSRKKLQLALISEYLSVRVGNTNRDVIPNAAWRLFAVPAMQQAHITTRQMQAGLNNQYCGSSIYKSNISRSRTALLAKTVISKGLALLATSDIYWDRVESIKPDGLEEVFDLTIAETHNFIAGDVIVHNSIEQDSDVVAFIYREEYYNPDTDRKNIADILIKKHRNGPTENIELYFDRKKQRFRSLETRQDQPFND